MAENIFKTKWVETDLVRHCRMGQYLPKSENGGRG